MNAVKPNLPPGDDIDALLGSFFKSEMPKKWPTFQPPTKRVLPFRPAAPPRRFILSSRVALAASVALLMLAGWLLSGSMPGPRNVDRNPIDHGPGGADTKGSRHHLFDHLPPVEDNRPGKVKSSLNLRQDDGNTVIEVIVEPLPSNK